MEIVVIVPGDVWLAIVHVRSNGRLEPGLVVRFIAYCWREAINGVPVLDRAGTGVHRQCREHRVHVLFNESG